MSKPEKPPKAKLFSSIIYVSDVNLEATMEILAKEFGEIDFRSEELNFDQTDYYAPEMGKGLKRVFVGFFNPVDREELAGIKIRTNGIEESFLKGRSRAVNIDPGLLTLENVVLATCKNYSHRIYIGNGIFAEITLMFKNGSYHSLEWTYPDYAQECIISIFSRMRESYKQLLRC